PLSLHDALPIWKLADDAAVILLAALEPALGPREVAAREREPRFGLGDVGAGEVADLELVAGRLEIGLEHLHLILVQGDDRAVADDVHVDADRIGEDIAFGGAKHGPAGGNSFVGGADRVADAAAVEQGIADIDAGAD